ncbi:MAG: LysE family translocator [Alphaproteobacteria bacterium HGW-Alphaproteobacteria-1]|jgi:threonine/homoserine/homoserine lactone efflux protein|nr:MAG: LysE family translocator [Alphaproteobacteria bacterium HGW-Alphaproteobacteria-1]
MIVDPLTLLAFVPAGLALNLTPGADMMFCLGLGLRAGPRPALAASAGISAGGMAHVTLAGLGLAAALAALPVLLDVIRWLGVAYLLWLAWGSLRMGPLRPDAPVLSAARAFREGMLVNLLNPKVILFVLAFVPQFVDPARAILPQFLVFGLILAAGGFVINGLVGVFAGGLGRRLATSPRLARALGIASATIFTALAIRLAVMQRI